MPFRRQPGRSTSRAFTLLEMVVVIVILIILLMILTPMFLNQSVRAKDARAKSYLTLAWQDLTVDSAADETNFGTATELAGQLRYDEPALSSQVVNDCSDTTLANFDDKRIAIVGPQTNDAAMVLCVRSSSGNIFEIIGPVNGADPTIIFLGDLAGKPPVNVVPPSIAGDVRYGQRLTAAEGGWESETQPVYSYQWERCDSSGNSCVNVGGATDNTYLVGASDVGSTFKVQVTASNADGSATATSAPTGSANTNLAGLPVNTGLPQISGPAAEERMLTADKGTWIGNSPISYGYHWLHSSDGGSTWTKISGATASSYTIPASEVGNELEVEVIATNSAGEQDAYSAATGPVVPPPANTGAPAISGMPQDTQTLTTSNGSWSYSPTSYSYQWQYSTDGGSSWTNIAGATDSTFTIPYSTYDGDKLRAQVTATNAAGSTSASSTATVAVVPVAPSNTGTPTISGTPQVGQTLTGAKGSWSGTPTISYAYQWQRSPNGSTSWSNITGGTAATYTAQGSDAGSYLRLEVTATNPAGSTWADSGATAQVDSAMPVGMLVVYAGTTPLPSGWAIADGSCGYASTTYPDLWTAIGTTYGGSGASNFCLPDMRGKLVLGKATSGIGSTLGSGGGAFAQSGTSTPWGQVTEQFSWQETPPAPPPLPHSHDASAQDSHMDWPGNWVSFGTPWVTLQSANESWTPEAASVSTSGTVTPRVDYTVSDPPVTTVRYLIEVSNTAAPPCGALFAYGSTTIPSGAAPADGQSSASCLDPAYGGKLPDLRGRFPLAVSTSGSYGTLDATGGTLAQTVTGTLDTSSTEAQVSPSWSDLLQENSHTHSPSWGSSSQENNGAGPNDDAGTGAPSVGANSNAGQVYTSSVYSATLAASGASAQQQTSAAFNTAYQTVQWIGYGSSSYGTATGTIAPYAGASAPAGWLLANGSCYSTTGTYAGLFSVIGYTYGGSGSSFCLPDLRGRFALGKAGSGTGSSLGAGGGSLSPSVSLPFAGWTPQLIVPAHTMAWSIPAHNHTVSVPGCGCYLGGGDSMSANSGFAGNRTSSAAGGGIVTASISSYAVNANPVPTANATPTVAPPPFTALNYIVKY